MKALEDEQPPPPQLQLQLQQIDDQTKELTENKTTSLISGTPQSKKQQTEKPTNTTMKSTTETTTNTNSNDININSVDNIDINVVENVNISSNETMIPETEESKELKEFFIEMFKKYGVCSTLFLKQHFNKRLKESTKHLTLDHFVEGERKRERFRMRVRVKVRVRIRMCVYIYVTYFVNPLT
jgi:hypothetical protein